MLDLENVTLTYSAIAELQAFVFPEGRMQHMLPLSWAETKATTFRDDVLPWQVSGAAQHLLKALKVLDFLQLGPVDQHRKLCSVLCNNLYGERI